MEDEKPQRQDILNLIKTFTGQMNILTIPRAFIDYTRSLDAALILSQMMYWSERAAPDGWFYKSYIEWERETTLGEYEVRKAVKLFRSNALLTTKIQKVQGNPTLHYKFHMDRFSDSFLKFLKERTPIFFRKEGEETEDTTDEKLEEPIKEETTTKTTTKTKSEKPAAPLATAAKGKSLSHTSDHALLMQHLFTRCGQFPDGPAQGKACKWILGNGFSPDEAIACFDHLMSETWRTGRISWLIVQKEIGVWKLKYGRKWEIGKLQVELSSLKGCLACGDLPGYLDRNRSQICNCNPMHETHERHGDYQRYVDLTLEEKQSGKSSGQVQPSDRPQTGVSQYPATAH